MEYTEEEFYGNNQKTVLENGDVVEAGINQDQTQINNENAKDKIALAMIATFFKTIFVLLCSLFYIMMVCIALNPKTAIKLFDFFGAEKASLSCYEKIYEDSGSLADLYNLVQKTIQTKDHDKTIIYITEMRSKNAYVEFCIDVNDATIQNVETKYWAYVGDLDSYLVSQNIIALYLSGEKDKALNLAISDLDNSNIYSFGISAYIDCLLSDKNYSDAKKKELILEFSQKIVEENGNVSVMDKIQKRRSLADISNGNGGKNDSILRLYTCLKIENVNLIIYNNSENVEKENQTKTQITSLQEEYNSLIN